MAEMQGIEGKVAGAAMCLRGVCGQGGRSSQARSGAGWRSEVAQKQL